MFRKQAVVPFIHIYIGNVHVLNDHEFLFYFQQ